jgi:hypothetical protein
MCTYKPVHLEHLTHFTCPVKALDSIMSHDSHSFILDKVPCYM